MNFPLATDSYKLSHYKMYPEGTQNVYSYFESRNGATYPYTVFFGLQALLKKYFCGKVVTQQDVDFAEQFSAEHVGPDIFNKEMWNVILNEHGGRLPLSIRAVAEGTPVPISNVLFTVEATDLRCAPLVSHCETLLTQIWAPSNVSTISRNIRQYIKGYFADTVDDDQQFLLDFMLHDFGFRGVSSLESAEMCGMGHLVNFLGTDTVPAVLAAQRYYGAGMAGLSVAASEHSVMTSLGENGEYDIVKRILKQFPKGIVSVVADSYNIKKFVKACGTDPELRSAILCRDGKFVVRPDSPRYVGDTPAAQILWLAGELERYFGASGNKKGYKVLHPKVGIIYGDGLSASEIKESVDVLYVNGWAASTCVYGQGGGLLQKHNRDTQRNAFKCSAQFRDGAWHDVYKKPLDSSKESKRGLLKLVKNYEGGYETVPRSDSRENLLVEVYRNGQLLRDYTWAEVKNNAK